MACFPAECTADRGDLASPWRFTMNEWKALGGRITLFPSAPPTSPLPSALELYPKVWGDEPDSFHKQQNALLPTVAQGRRHSIITNCFAHPTRIDLNLSPVPTPSGTQEPELVFIEDTDQLYTELKGIIKVLAKGIISSSISRVALGLQFVAVKRDSLEANKTLIQTMPQQYRMKVTNEEEFIFQVNRPRKSSKVESVKMNFVTKWSVENVQVVAMPVPAGGQPMPAAAPSIKNFLIASVSFDNNNFATRPLTPEEQSQLLDESLTEASVMQKSLGLNIEGF